MAEQRYLRKLEDGYVYGWTESLSELPNMVECDKDGRRLDLDKPDNAVIEDTTEIEILGARYDVPNYIVPAVEKLLAAKTPAKVDEPTTRMELDGTEVKMPNSLVDPVTRVGKRMLEAVEGTKDLQNQVSKLMKEKNELEKHRARIEEENELLKKRIKEAEEPRTSEEAARSKKK